MAHRERIKAIYVGVDIEEAVRQAIDDDCRWFIADSARYEHPEGRPIFDVMHGLGPKTHHGQPGCFANCEDVAEIDDYPWPDARYLNLDDVRDWPKSAADYFRFGGTWSCFFHLVADFLGMENYFMNMYTSPDVVHAVTRRVVGLLPRCEP